MTFGRPLGAAERMTCPRCKRDVAKRKDGKPQRHAQRIDSRHNRQLTCELGRCFPSTNYHVEPHVGCFPR